MLTRQKLAAGAFTRLSGWLTWFSGLVAWFPEFSGLVSV
jgi:hypothetical protein